MISRITLDIIGIRASSFLRSPYADSQESLNATIHAGVRNRSGIQRKRLGAPEKRYEREVGAAEAAHRSARTYDALTRAGA